MVTLTDRAARHYRAMRHDAVPARQAFLIARGEDRVRAWESEHVTRTDYRGETQLIEVSLEHEGEYRLEIHYDETYDLDDTELYTDEDREARYRGDWATYWVRAVAVVDGIEGEDSLGGIDAGYFPSTDLDTDQQLLDAALEHGLFDAAREEALRLNASPM